MSATIFGRRKIGSIRITRSQVASGESDRLNPIQGSRFLLRGYEIPVTVGIMQALTVSLFREQRGILKPVTVLRRVSQLPWLRESARAAAAIAAKKRGTTWHHVESLAIWMERYADVPPGLPGHGPLTSQESSLVADLIWEARARAAHEPQRVLCSFCWRPAVGFLKKTRAVCARHIPPSADYQKARRLIKWAGGYDSLRGLFVAEMTRIRATVNDGDLEAVIRETKIEPKTREWWAAYPFPWATFDLELGVHILAHSHITKRYQHATLEARRQNGRNGGRPRHDDDRAVAKARKLMERGQSLYKAAAAVGMSGPTLWRRLKR